MSRSARDTARARADSRDEGSALVLALVAIIICSLIAVPTLKYATAVIRGSQVVTSKAIRQEAVKGGLRIALADPIKLFAACKGNGAGSAAVTLGNPGLATPVTTTCANIQDVTAENPLQLRSARVTVQVGAPAPAGTAITGIYPGVTYAGSPPSTTTAWYADKSYTSDFNKVWLPYLPTHALNPRSATPYTMPAGYMTSGYTSCTVYFPGTYIDPINITSATPVMFTSGIYYFKQPITISGNAKVVVGDGAVDGCTTDQKAAFNAVNGPLTHNITGIGATWIFGAAASLTVNNTVAGNPSLIFNRRYVATTDTATLSSAGVSILSVNGQTVSGTSGELVLPYLQVPLSEVSSTSSATSQSYDVSTLVPPALPTVATNPIIDINMTTTATMTVAIPGYVGVPQGAVRINVAAGFAANKTVQIGGGIVAAQMLISAVTPATFLFGIDNPSTQKYFKIVSTSAGSPLVTSTAIVQINSNGAYAVNSWNVQ